MSDLKTGLVRLLRVAYPHPAFPDGPYERTAESILAGFDDAQRAEVESGLVQLSEAGFETAADGEAILRGMADAPFFVAVRGAAVTTLYNDHEVWDLLGYEGESFSKGGYINRGFNDLDWLPDPRIEEYDGPEEFVEVAEQDRPASV